MKSARLPKSASNSDSKHVQNAWKYHLSTSPSQCQADIQRRARLIPQSSFMRNSVLNDIVSRMFKESVKSAAPNNACSNCRSLNANFFDSFVPPKPTPRRGVATFIPSPNYQIIRKSTKIRQLRERSFSQSCLQQTNGGDNIPRTSARINFFAKKRNNDGPIPSRRIRVVLRRPPGKRLRKLHGPPIVSASSIPITNLLPGAYAGPGLDNGGYFIVITLLAFNFINISSFIRNRFICPTSSEFRRNCIEVG